MPIYEYKCECSIDTIVPHERSILDKEPEYKCLSCGNIMKRHYGSFGIQFNGSGFYATDNKK